MKALIVASLMASAASIMALAGSPSGTYNVACNTAAPTIDCKINDNGATAGYSGVGVLDYVDNLFTNGWDNVTVTMNQTVAEHSLDQKYYGMGYVEGYVTYERIYQNFANVKSEFESGLTADVANWWGNNTVFVNKLVAENPTDPFAAKLGNLVQQIKGLYAGYQAGCAAAGQPTYAAAIDETMMFYINWQAEIGDIVSAYEPESEFAKKWHAPENQHCSALVKPVPGDLFVSHIAWTGFSWMMRQYKSYRFEGLNAVTIAGHPGMIHSMDDWYMNARGLAVIETTIIINNPSLFVTHLKDQWDVIPAFYRVMIANYLSADINSWMDTFKKYNSGTYNNQWIVVDMKKYSGDANAYPDGLLGVIETIPGGYAMGDETAFMRKNGHWPSYNFAYFPLIQKLANYSGEVDQYGEGMSYNGYNRARIFARDANKVTDLASMETMMQYNNYKNDPLSLIPNCTGAINNTCNPAYSAMLSISSRGDLNPPGTVADYGIMLNMVGQRNHGGIDMKIASWTGMMKSNGTYVARVKNGPTTSNGLPVFQFSTCAIKNIPNLGLPDRFDFAIESFTTVPAAGNDPTPTPNPADEYDNTGMGAALLIISLIIIVFSVTMLVVCHFLPKRQLNSGYARV